VPGHPSKTGVNERSGTSGSTGWSAVFRARLYLEKVLADDNVTDTGGRLLTIKKLTGGVRSAPIELTTGDGGVLIRKDEPVVEAGPFDPTAGLAALERAKREFLDLVVKYDDQGRPLSPNPGARNYAPNVIAKTEGGKGRRNRVAELERTMNDLFNEKRLFAVVDGYRPTTKRSSPWCRGKPKKTPLRLRMATLLNLGIPRKTRGSDSSLRSPYTPMLRGRFARPASINTK
jgi:hypothetical protein